MAQDVHIQPQNSSRPPPIALGINVEKPKFPQYAIYSKRIDSFELWPEYIPVDKSDLIEAGLVYTGVGDSVRCFFCGGGLRNWERGDVPMEEHAKWYPKCPHLLLVKGQEYVDRISRGEPPEIDGSITEGFSKANTLVNHLDSAAAQSCIEMGFSREMVEKAIRIFTREYETVDFKGKDLCKILFDLEENPNRADINEDTETEVDASVEEEELEPLESLIKENHRLKTNTMCKICLESRIDIIFLPCGHMVSCPQCAPALTKCPVCRKIINGQIKAFFAPIN